MGNQTSNITSDPNTSGAVSYSAGDVLDGIKNGGSVSGGCGCVMGGYTEMQQYGESIYSKAKEKLIRNIADDTFSALGLSSKKPKKTDSIDKIVAELTRLAPGGKGKAKFTADFYKSSKAQKDLCHAMAKAINRNYGSSIIPMNASEAEICAKVAEVMNTLFTGLHTEFLSVAGDVSRIVRNIETLKRFIDASYKRQGELAKSCGDPQINIQVDNTTEFYNRIQVELDRQLAVLANLMNATIDPASQNLIKALEDNKDFYGTVRELREDLGTPAFGNKLAMLLSGVSSVAHSADLIDKALRRIGMSVQEFKSSKSPAELRMKVLKHIQDKNPGSRELDQMLQAADLIFRNDYSHDAIAKLLNTPATARGRGDNVNRESDDEQSDDGHVDAAHADEYGMGMGMGMERMGGDCGMDAMSKQSSNLDANRLDDNRLDDNQLDNENKFNVENDNANIQAEDMQPEQDEVAGGNTGNGLYWDRKNLSKKIERKDTYRDLILKDFKKVIQDQYRNIVEAADHVARNIGSTIPVNEDLERFVNVFAQIDSLNRENLHIALSGYPRDAESRYLRDQFLDKYRLLVDVIKPLTNGPAGPQFKEIQRQCEGLIKTIDDFADKMVKSLTEIHIDRPEDIRAELKKSSNLFFGNAEYGAAGGNNLSFGDGSFVALKKVQNELKYYVAIAHIKTNLARVSEEMKDYADDYDEIVGEEAAYLIDSIKREYQALINETELTSPDAIGKNESLGITAVIAKGGVGETQSQIAAHAAAAVTAAAARAGAPVLSVAATTAATDKTNTDRREALISFYTFQMNSKVKMVEVAQSIDIYMRHFADGIARDPDSIKSVIKMLDQVEVVAKWFTEKSGDNLANLFEFFPAGVNRAAPAALFDSFRKGPATTPKLNRAHYYEDVSEQSAAHNLGDPFVGRVLETKKEADELQKQTEKCIKSMRALENILSTFFSIGDKFAGEELKSKSILTPGYILSALFDYINASAFANKYCPSQATAVNNPYLTGLENDGLLHQAAQVKVELKNTGTVPEQSTDLLASESLGYAGNDRENHSKGGGFTHLVSGVPAANLKNISVAMSAIPYDSRVDTVAKTSDWWTYHNPGERTKQRLNRAAWLDTFYDTDMLFVMVIKSIITKILAVVDAYRLFNKPVDLSNNITSYSIVNPLRGILGGSGDEEFSGGAKAKIMPEVLELYVRLPLLAEWYRGRLSLESQSQGTAPVAADTWRLVVVPSIDGIWSGFMSLLFDKAEYVKQGNYTEAQLDKMIDEMNLIYKHYKSRYPKATIRNIIVGFISEINHAFGFMRRDQINEYLNNRRKYLNDTSNRDYNSKQSEDEFNNYDLLDADDQYGRAPVPSDKYLTVALKQQQVKKRNMVYLQEVVNRLREDIDKNLRQGVQTLQTSNNFTFNETLTNYKKELEAAKDENERHRMVVRLLQGSDRLNVGSVDKFIMIHEAVAAPLNQLFNIYKVLAGINAFFHGASIERLNGFFNSGLCVAVGGALNDATANKTAYLAHLQAAYSPANNMKDLAENYKQFHLLGQQYLIATPAGVAAGTTTHRIFTGIDYTSLLRDVISMLSDLASNPNKLIQVNVSSSDNVNIDWSNLESLAMELFAQVKSNINSLRLDLSYGKKSINANGQVSLLEDYENRNICGSVPWLEERLVESLFRDRDRSGLGSGLNWFIDTVKKLSNNDAVFNALAVGGAGFDYTLAPTIREFIYQMNGGVLIFDASDGNNTGNNLKTFPFNVLSIKLESDLISADQKTALQELASGRVLSDPIAADSIIPVAAITDSLNVLNRWNLITPGVKNFVCFFNKLVHMYLYTAFDESTMKIYTPLFENFMNSAAAKEVNDTTGTNLLNNVLTFAGATSAKAGLAARNALALKNGAILYKSTVETMKSLMQNMDMRLKKKRHIFESLAEVPVYMKERMKCNLPLFSKMFNIVFERTDLLRKLLNNAGFENVCDGGVAARNGNKTVYDLQLSRISDLALSIKKCCDSVHKELQDTAPYFMDLGKDFISDYKQRYGTSPFMPASDVILPQLGYSGNTITVRVRGVIRIPAFNNVAFNFLLLPTRENGSDVYRYNFASRLLLVRPDIEPSIDHMPGAKEIYNNYSDIAAKAKHISAQEYAGTVKNLVRAARFLNDGVVYSRFLDKNDRFDNNNYVSNSPYNMIYNSAALNGASYLGLFNDSLQTPRVPAVARYVAANFITKKCVQFQTTTLRTILQLTENSVKETSKKEFAKLMLTAAANTPASLSRSDLQVLNIIDLDVVPINVHALMREVPFVNILNYAYTFDRMVQELIVPNYMTTAAAGQSFIRALDDVNSTKELMVKMLIHPYTSFSLALNTKSVQYLGIMASLFNGNDDFHLGRPRYLSDQLWNKVLLNSPVEFSDEKLLPFEMGPAGYLAANAMGRVDNTVARYPDVAFRATNAVAPGLPALVVAPLTGAPRRTAPILPTQGVFNIDRTQMAAMPTSQGLRYWHDKQKNWVVANTTGLEVAAGAAAGAGTVLDHNQVQYCAQLGALRFDTKLIRNLTWITQLQRLVRVALITHLSRIETPVVRGLKIADPKLTEFNANDAWSAGDYNASNNEFM